MKKILILGSGFGGFYTALNLHRHNVKKFGAEITIISRDNYLLFSPFLCEVVTGIVNIKHAVEPIRRVIRGKAIKFIQGEIQEIDLGRRQVLFDSGEEVFDLLVIGLGSTTNFYGNESFRKHCFTMKSLPDAIHLRNHIIGQFERAATTRDMVERKKLLTFIVIGGGQTGVELVTELSDYIYRHLLSYYPEIHPDVVKLILMEARGHILMGIDKHLINLAERVIRDKKIELMTETKLKRVEEDCCILEDGTVIPTNTCIWTAGIKPGSVVEKLAVKKDFMGRVEVNHRLELPLYEGIFVIGDCASFKQSGSVSPLPPEAQIALQQAAYLAKLIVKRLNGEIEEGFHFFRYGRLTSLGERHAVVDIFGLKFGGFFAWFLWRTVYLLRHHGLINKIKVIIDWSIDIFLERNIFHIRNSPHRSHKNRG